MKIPISKRLLQCCRFVRPGDVVADIGCDHGYLGIYLLHNKIASRVIASDINPQPLQSAMRNAEKYGVQDHIQFFLSEGVQKIPQDFDTMVCAGMGADTIISILEGAPWLKRKQYRLILQCQSKTPMLREYLSCHDWHICQETVLRDGRFLYTVMVVCQDAAQPKLSVGQTYFSPALLKSAAPELKEYYESIIFRLKRAVDSQKEAADPKMDAALKELRTLEGEFK